MQALLPLRDPEFWANPYPLLNALRDEHRVACTEDGVRVILRYADVEALLNGGGFINEGISLLERRGFQPGDPIYEWRKLALGSLHGAEHQRLRSAVGRAITRHSLDAFRPVIAQRAAQLVDALSGRAVDGVAAIGDVLPLIVISDYLGIPEDERRKVDTLVRQGQAEAFGTNVTPQVRERVNALFATLLVFIERLLNERKLQPRNDLLTRLLNAGDVDGRLSAQEIIVLFLNLFIGATESTASAMVTGLWCLGKDADLLAELRRRPALVERFVEEVLRLYPPNVLLANKIAACEQDFCGERFAAGESVIVPLAAPNRDPSVFARADVLDIQREPKRHFTFSFGSHFCLGQALARAQLVEFFRVLSQRVKRVDAAVDQPRWLPYAAITRMQTLPLRLAP